MPENKALAVMTTAHAQVVSWAGGSFHSPLDKKLLREIASVVRYLVDHPERLAGEGQVVVKREEIENLRYLVSSLIGMEYDDATLSKIDYRIGRWLAGSPTAQESKDG